MLLHSLASAAAVTWASMKPLSTPGSSAKKARMPREVVGDMNRSVRRSLIVARVVIAAVMWSSGTATDPAWKLPPLTTS